VVWDDRADMNQVRKSALVPYSAEQMFDLVNAVEDYPNFLPWCSGVRILARAPHTIKATVSVAKGTLRQSFTTHNLMEAGRRIEMRLIEGPFKYLHGTWSFHPLGEAGCEVVLSMQYEFGSGVLSLAFGSAFNHIANTLVDAFAKRARDLYGGP
jgi:ribosome-associated toxin RatA of RatAB toxin-antitoxin module